MEMMKSGGGFAIGFSFLISLGKYNELAGSPHTSAAGLVNRERFLKLLQHECASIMGQSDKSQYICIAEHCSTIKGTGRSIIIGVRRCEDIVNEKARTEYKISRFDKVGLT